MAPSEYNLDIYRFSAVEGESALELSGKYQKNII
jgi:hypothetical protein